MTITTGSRRRDVLAAVAGAAVLAPSPAEAKAPRVRFDRAAYDRYIQLMNACDSRFLDYYADDVQFVMNMRGKDMVRAFYARQRPYVSETLAVTFFCSDASGAAAEVLSEIRCIKDCDDRSIFGRALVAGETQSVRGCLLYRLDRRGLIAEIKGPPPEILQPWHRAPA